MKISVHNCEWCGDDIRIYYTTEATYNHYHFCNSKCKSVFGQMVYLMTDRVSNVLAHITSGGIPEVNYTREVLQKHGIVRETKRGYELTPRGKRVYEARLEYKKESTDE